ncbi:MAG: arsenosugar biosynthesis radical SAM protein ArsS [Deltaproteobacteria bacterium]|jgi:radical SAM/Cys-rich protein|nr:arsenosugar biosynthesis radical SAM protein ArsS [Deltaproteobacteria bacterium]
MNNFDQAVREVLGAGLESAVVQTIQVNLGLVCNLSCRHCHVEASPHRNESMTWETMQSLLRLTEALPEARVDLTGGAPELNPNFRPLLDALIEQGHQVQVRTNLTVFFEAGQGDTPEFLADRGVHLVASLPCYLDDNVDKQRGGGVYKRSVAALRRLNSLGYGRQPRLPLNLVYNPGGAFLPPDQATLEDAYRRELRERFDVEFTRLLTITNMPMGRFLSDLQRDGQAEDYKHLLEDSFNQSTIDGLMCRHQICIAWDGTLSDCDFNSALGLSLAGNLPRHIDQLDPSALEGRPIVTGEHCFGCTAGCGSSCGGALVA